MSHVRSLSCLAPAVAAAAAAIMVPRPVFASDPETRRQVMSLSIDYAFSLTGNGVVIGQIESTVPGAHVDIPRTLRNPDAPVAMDTHPVEVAGIMCSRNATNTGMAPDAQLFCDGYGNNGFAGTTLTNDNNFLDAIRWQVTLAPVAKVSNSSHTLLPIGGGTASPDGLQKAVLGVDYYISQNNFLFVKSSGNSGAQPITVPGDAYNGVTVGAVTNPDAAAGVRTATQGPVDRRWNRLANFSSWGTNAAGLSKPDLVAPGALSDAGNGIGFQMATLANGFANTAGEVGTSFSAPHVSGIAAQLYQQMPNADHRLIKAVLMNGADHTVRNNADQPWTAGTAGLDPQLGTGMVDAWSSLGNLLGGGGRIGTATAFANAGSGDITVANVATGPDAKVVATVTWDRAVTSNGVAAPNDVYAVAANQPHFALRADGPTSSVVQNTAGGSVQHINAIVTEAGNFAIKVNNNGNGAGTYSVAWAVSPPDVNPNTNQPVYFTVRDQVHRVMGAGNDRIIEGRNGTAVNGRSAADAGGAAVGVDSGIYSSTFNINNATHRTGTQLGLQEVAGAGVMDDHVNDISFGMDDIRGLTNGGGQVYFSVDAYATGLSPHRPGNPANNAVYNEATIVNESAGDIFLSSQMAPGASAIQNGNAKIKNQPNGGFIRPTAGNGNTSYADSYYMGLTGPRTADNEDDVTGLEGLGQRRIDGATPQRNGYTFFTLDRNSPSGHRGDVMVARDDMPNVAPHVFAAAGQLGLNAATDDIDGLCVQWFSNPDAQGWPVYAPGVDLVLFSVDRDSVGAGGAVATEAAQGEVSGDIFWGSVAGSNLLYLEATDLGLQEFGGNANYKWISDNLDALDLPDAVVPEPSAFLLMSGVLGVAATVRRRRQGG